MAKIFNPLASIGAVGTVAKLFTFSHAPSGYSIRKISRPTGELSLSQQYQRWDYQFWLTFWQALSPAEKAAQEKLGTAHHMPGLAWFMKAQLSTLPHLLARYHLDDADTLVCHDSSSYHTHAVYTPCTSLAATIDKGAYMNGVSSMVEASSHAHFAPSTNQFTVAMFLTPASLGTSRGIFRLKQYVPANMGFEIYLWATAKLLVILGHGAAPDTIIWSANSFPLSKKHLAIVFTGTQVIFYWDGIPETPQSAPVTVAWGIPDLAIGRNPVGIRWHGLADEFSLWDIALTQPQVALLASRRWPR
jgi:hypothetical protein